MFSVTAITITYLQAFTYANSNSPISSVEAFVRAEATTMTRIYKSDNSELTPVDETEKRPTKKMDKDFVCLQLIISSSRIFVCMVCSVPVCADVVASTSSPWLLDVRSPWGRRGEEKWLILKDLTESLEITKRCKQRYTLHFLFQIIFSCFFNRFLLVSVPAEGPKSMVRNNRLLLRLEII